MWSNLILGINQLEHEIDELVLSNNEIDFFYSEDLKEQFLNYIFTSFLSKNINEQ